MKTVVNNYLERIKQLRLIDDDFMSIVFDGNIKAAQLVLSIILGRKDIKVQSVKAQHELKSVEGHSVKFDIFAVDETGKPYDIEIQRSDKGAVPERARYNSEYLMPIPLLKEKAILSLRIHILYLLLKMMFLKADSLYIILKEKSRKQISILMMVRI